MYLCSEDVLWSVPVECEHLLRLSKALGADSLETASRPNLIALLRIDAFSHGISIMLIIFPHTTSRAPADVQQRRCRELEARFTTGQYTRAARGALVRRCSAQPVSLIR